MGDGHPTDSDLLHRYAECRCEDAFAELVRRHVDLVYSVAFRRVRRHDWAEEVTQSVFVDLARAGRRLRRGTVLAAWLHQVARRSAIDWVRREGRRMAREKAALELNSLASTGNEWSRIEPILDEALSRLGSADRSAILLRFFENRSLREVGLALGTSDDAAQKRIARAVERLRGLLARGGVRMTASGLTAAVSGQAMGSAPAGLAPVLVAKAIAQAAATVPLFGWPLALVMNTAHKTALAGLVVTSVTAGFGVGWYRGHESRSSSAPRVEFEPRLPDRAGERERLQAENEKLSAEIAALRSETDEWKRDRLELLRLRAEVTDLRAGARQRPSGDPAGKSDPAEAAMKAWFRRVEIFKQLAEHMPDKAIPELRLLTQEDWLELAKEPLGRPAEEIDFDDPRLARLALSAARAKAKQRLMWVFSRALDGYVKAHDDRLPREMADLVPYLMNRHVVGPASAVEISAGSVDDEILGRYRLVTEGRWSEVGADQPIIVEAGAADPEFDTVLRVGKHWVGVSDAKDLVDPIARRDGIGGEGIR